MKTEYYFVIVPVLFIALVILVISVLAAEKRALEGRRIGREKAAAKEVGAENLKKDLSPLESQNFVGKFEADIWKFEEEIIFKRGHIETRLERSKARLRLIRHGKAALSDIVDHLDRVKFNQDGEIAYAWRNLLEEMRSVHNLSGTVEHYMLLDSWIDWAREHAETITIK
jgi:hypothetical protein